MLFIFILSFINIVFSSTCFTSTEITEFPKTIDELLSEDLPESTIIDKSSIKHTIKAHYYKLTSQTDETILVSTCNSYTIVDTTIGAFSSCDLTTASNCIEINDNANNCGTSSKLELKLTKNIPVYIAVYTQSSSFGRYRISFETTERKNTNCVEATEITSFPAIVEGNIESGETVKLGCTPLGSVRGLWYTFKGDGKFVYADTCNSGIDFDAYIAVIKGPIENKCENMECVANNDGGCPTGGEDPARVYFKTEVGVQYYILVSSLYTTTGNFQLTMNTLGAAVPYICEQAMSITSLPFERHVQINSSWTKTYGYCDATTKGLQYAGLFLTFKGTGAAVNIHTCDTTRGETKIEIFDGCDNTKCIETTNTYCNGNQYYVSFIPQEGREYYIRAYCISQPCDMVVRMEYKSMSHNERCENAQLVTSAVSKIVYTENLVETMHGCNDQEEKGKAVWYQFKAVEALSDRKKGYHIYVTDENGNTGTNYIEVHNSCGSFECSAKRYPDVIIGMERTAFVACVSKNTEKIVVQIIVEDANSHLTCQTAKQITIPFYSLDWNIEAEKQASICGRTTPSEAVWYKFSVENDQKITLSTCSSNVKYDSVIEVGTGKCGEMSCVKNIDDKATCERGNITVINAAAKTEYTVLVGAQTAGATNQFEFIAYSDVKPENSKCDKPIDVPMNKKIYRVNTYTEYGYTTKMTYSDGTTRDVVGHYYRIPKGYKGKITFMTCATGTVIPTFISLHDSCSYEASSQISKPTSISKDKYADYTVGRCGAYGSYLQYETDGTKDIIAFFGNAKDGQKGFIDVEIFLQVTNMNGDDETNESKNDNDNNDNNNKSEQSPNENEQNTTKIVVGVIFGIIGVIIIAMIIAIVIFWLKKKRNTGGFSESSYLTLNSMRG